MPIHQRGFVADFAEKVQSQGRLTFALDEVVAAGGPSGEALEKAVYRLQASGRVTRISRNSDVVLIVPPEYRTLGAPPVECWLDDVMNQLGLAYYVGLLSAAGGHGESHYAVMETQVVASRSRRPIQVGRTRIRFFVSATVASTPIERRVNQWSEINLSTPAATLLDLLRYHRVGAARIAEIASTLGPKLKARDLRASLMAARSVPSAQRLGFLLEQVGAKTAAEVVGRWLDGENLRPVELEPGAGDGWALDSRWLVRVNARLEASA